VRIGERFKNGRYTVLQKLGWGHFSTVWLVLDGESGERAAMKVVKSAPHYTEAARDEVTLLAQIRDSDPAGAAYCVRMLDSFDHAGPHGRHVCMVFEVMGDNLLTLIRMYDHRGIPVPVVRHLASQILVALDHMHTKCRIIHTGDACSTPGRSSAPGCRAGRCLRWPLEEPPTHPTRPLPVLNIQSAFIPLADLKPENVMLKEPVKGRRPAPAGGAAVAPAPAPAPSKLAAAIAAGQVLSKNQKKKLRKKAARKPGADGSRSPSPSGELNGEPSGMASGEPSGMVSGEAASSERTTAGEPAAATNGAAAGQEASSGPAAAEQQQQQPTPGAAEGGEPPREAPAVASPGGKVRRRRSRRRSRREAGTATTCASAAPPCPFNTPITQNPTHPPTRPTARPCPQPDLAALSERLLTMDCKIVDFGNACWTFKHFTDDIQTRQYRSPEVRGAPAGRVYYAPACAAPPPPPPPRVTRQKATWYLGGAKRTSCARTRVLRPRNCGRQRPGRPCDVPWGASPHEHYLFGTDNPSPILLCTFAPERRATPPPLGGPR
jgi:serine/threonine-protein kinase SRPK3